MSKHLFKIYLLRLSIGNWQNIWNAKSMTSVQNMYWRMAAYANFF